MRRFISIKNLALILFLSCGITAAFAQPISSSELINHAAQYDGKVVVYEGELVGDVMVRGNFSWLNINDGVNAIGIWANNSLIKDIKYTGSFKSRGDWVEVSGVFHRSCSEHGGDLDIHAQALRKISAGKFLPEHLNTGKVKLALIFMGVLCLVLILRQLGKAPRQKLGK
jgi:hypothetical protein